MVVDNRSTREKDEKLAEKHDVTRFNKQHDQANRSYARSQENNLSREPRDVPHGGATEAPYTGTTDELESAKDAWNQVERELEDIEHRENEPKVPTSKRGEGRGAPRARE